MLRVGTHNNVCDPAKTFSLVKKMSQTPITTIVIFSDQNKDPLAKGNMNACPIYCHRPSFDFPLDQPRSVAGACAEERSFIPNGKKDDQAPHHSELLACLRNATEAYLHDPFAMN